MAFAQIIIFGIALLGVLPSAEILRSDALPVQAQQAETVLAVRGAGATFPEPIYAKWLADFNSKHVSVKFTYEATGSEAGIRSLLNGSVDFGASDNPDILQQLAPQLEGQYLLFPSVIGAVVPIVNLPGVVKDIAVTPQVLAGMYLGTIKNWNDPRLRDINPGIRLPDLDISVVHRRDGSGTTYSWTDYLSRTTPEWKAQVGSSLAPNWKTGKPAIGNDGVAKLVKELGGSIGYVEYIYALKNHLSYARVENSTGEFVRADVESISKAASTSLALDSGFKGSIVNSPGKGAYPIATYTWLVVPAHFSDEAKRSAMTDFLRWMLHSGQRQAAMLGYVGLPDSLVTKEELAIGQLR